MNTTSHPVAPEEVMAFLDGELSSAETQLVSEHLGQCAECAALADQFRQTSEWLARWDVPPIPMEVERSVMGQSAGSVSSQKGTRASDSLLSRFWNWKWGLAGGGALVAALFLMGIITPHKNESLSEYAMRLPQSYSDSYNKPRRSGSVGILREQQSSAPTPKPEEKRKMARPPQLADELGAPNFDETHPGPMIARSVSLIILVKDFTNSRSSLDAILARHHGYSAQLNITTPENGARAIQASLRIPAPELEAALREFKTLGRVENETQSGEEVTQQHADLVARLQNSREAEVRLRGILQQRTGKIEDVLQVEEEIARVRGEIERMEGEQKALEHRVDFASVEVQLSEEYKARLGTPADSTSTRIQNAFVAGYRNASEAVLGIILFFAEYGPALLIWLAFLGLPIALLWRRYRRVRSRL